MSGKWNDDGNTLKFILVECFLRVPFITLDKSKYCCAKAEAKAKEEKEEQREKERRERFAAEHTRYQAWKKDLDEQLRKQEEKGKKEGKGRNSCHFL